MSTKVLGQSVEHRARRRTPLYRGRRLAPRPNRHIEFVQTKLIDLAVIGKTRSHIQHQQTDPESVMLWRPIATCPHIMQSPQCRHYNIKTTIHNLGIYPRSELVPTTAETAGLPDRLTSLRSGYDVAKKIDHLHFRGCIFPASASTYKTLTTGILRVNGPLPSASPFLPTLTHDFSYDPVSHNHHRA